jgi:hypothetical protein
MLKHMKELRTVCYKVVLRKEVHVRDLRHPQHNCVQDSGLLRCDLVSGLEFLGVLKEHGVFVFQV